MHMVFIEIHTVITVWKPVIYIICTMKPTIPNGKYKIHLAKCEQKG